LSFVLRPYQLKALECIRGLFRIGKKKVLLHLSTGGGKTAVFCELAKLSASNGKRVCIVVRGRSLVDQASKRLSSYDVDHGVLMANDHRFDDTKLVQVVSVDTCVRRNNYPNADLLVIDEAHLATSDSFMKFLEHYQHSYIVSVTATPWVEAGMMHLVADKDSVVYPISLQELIDNGHLVAPKYYVSSRFSVDGIAIRNGEYKDDEAILSFKEQGVVGHVVENYLKNCVGRTLLFAINIEHANWISQIFKDSSIDNIVITGDTPIDERMDLVYRHDLIINIGTMTTGVDIPDLKNLILCRPTQSKNLYVQMLGRGTRPYPGKKFFNVFDHVGNVETHGFIEDEEPAKPEPFKRTRHSIGEAPVKVCKQCSYVVHAAKKECPECGFIFPPSEKKTLKIGEGELKEIVDKDLARFQRDLNNLMRKAWKNGWKKGSIYYKLIDKHGIDHVEKNKKLLFSAYKIFDQWEKDGVNSFGEPKGNKYFSY